MANATVTVKASGGDYTSLNAALAGESADLTANCHSTGGAGILTIECYAMSDTTAASTGTGYTTSADYYINIVVPTAERHLGVWSTSKYRLITTGLAQITCQANFTRFEGMQVSAGTIDDNNINGIKIDGSYGIYITNCLITRVEKSYTYGNYAAAIDFGTDVGGSNWAWNNIIADWDFGAAKTKVCGIVTTNHSSGNTYLYNNTVIGVSGRNSGIVDGFGSVIAINNIVSGFADGFDGDSGWGNGFHASSNYNASDLASDAPGANSRNSQTFTFVDADNGDYHLAATDGGARDYGTNLSASFTTDIDGQTRSGTWDIGADEYSAHSLLLKSPRKNIMRSLLAR